MSSLFGQTSLPPPLILWQCMFGNHNQRIRNYIVPLDYYSEKWELNVVMWRWTENLIQLSWTDLEQRKVKSPVVSAFNNIVICDYWSPNKQFQILWTLVTRKCLHPVTPTLDVGRPCGSRLNNKLCHVSFLRSTSLYSFCGCQLIHFSLKKKKFD